MPSAFALAKIASAQAKIRAKGQLVHYFAAATAIIANDPSRPFLVGTPGDGQPDPNAPIAHVDVYMAFFDAKARGSSTQGMVSEFINKTDIVGGNKEGLFAGGQVAVKQGDVIDRNTGIITGYPLYKVSKFKTIDVDGAVILYTIQFEL